MRISEYFERLKTKDIICWGSGKHFRNSTCAFLQKSGLIENLRGFVDVPGSADVKIGDRCYGRIGKDELAMPDSGNTVILIAVTGYEEILMQIRSDPQLSLTEAVPAVCLEALYEDMQLLLAEKPPLNFRKADKPVIPGIIHGIWFSSEPMPELYLSCLESWKRYAPELEIRIWDLETYKPDHCLFFEQAIEHNYALNSVMLFDIA